MTEKQLEQLPEYVDSESHMKYYKTRAIDRSSTSRPNNVGTVDISRPAIAPANPNIAITEPIVNTDDQNGGNKKGEYAGEGDRVLAGGCRSDGNLKEMHILLAAFKDGDNSVATQRKAEQKLKETAGCARFNRRLWGAGAGN